MDLNGFNKLTYPNYFTFPAQGTVYKTVRNEYVPPKTTEPIENARYPAFAGIADDARFVTDYRPHCTQNTPPGQQFMTKQWIVNHADTLIQMSRKRQSEWSGASLPMANTVPPPAQIVHSTPFENEIQPSGARFGIGLERSDAKAPVLFGTFQIPPTRTEILNNTKRIGLTHKYEGGRNSLRGDSRKADYQLETHQFYTYN
jgi:hypothetical protein